MKLRIDRINEVRLRDEYVDKVDVATAIHNLLKENNDGMITVIPTPMQIINNPERYYVLYDSEKENINDAIIGVIALMRRDGQIMRLCVKREFRRQGFGRMLLIYAIFEAKTLGLGYVYLFVRKNNSVMQKLVEKIGFRRVREKENSYEYELDL